MTYELADTMRIIASDGGLLSINDRAAILRGANELEEALRASIDAERKLLEANAHRLALNDQLRDVRRKLPPLPPSELSWEMTSGWLNLSVL